MEPGFVPGLKLTKAQWPLGEMVVSVTRAFAPPDFAWMEKVVFSRCSPWMRSSDVGRPANQLGGSILLIMGLSDWAKENAAMKKIVRTNGRRYVEPAFIDRFPRGPRPVFSNEII